jgi:hypothetical protein
MIFGRRYEFVTLAWASNSSSFLFLPLSSLAW